MKRLLSLLWHDVYLRHPSESGFTGPGADRYKFPAKVFDRQLEALARVRADSPILVDELDGYAGREVPFAVTVDDGGLSYYSIVAERLESRGWRGHCMVTTDCIGRPGFLDGYRIRELRRRGHLIGTHSVSHPQRFDTLPLDRLIREWSRSRKSLEDILGEAVSVGSVPGGCFSARVALAAREAGLRLLFTSEPQIRLRRLAGVATAGRFALRRGCDPEVAARLARRDRAALFREWAAWNGKKLLKNLLGSAYPRVTACIGRAGHPSSAGARSRTPAEQ